MYTYKELINPPIRQINDLAKKGWRIVGVGVVTNHTGADRIVYLEGPEELAEYVDEDKEKMLEKLGLEKHVDKPSA